VRFPPGFDSLVDVLHGDRRAQLDAAQAILGDRAPHRFEDTPAAKLRERERRDPLVSPLG
jgi:hypothetical protein